MNEKERFKVTASRQTEDRARDRARREKHLAFFREHAANMLRLD